MTYKATVQLKFDATYTHDYNRGFASHLGDDDFLPEEHCNITAPAHDLNARQYFKLFEKFLLCVGMTPESIHSGAMSLVFNDWSKDEDRRKVCEEYELTMNEDLRSRFEEWKKDEEKLDEKLTQEEIQELRTKKQELTEYGKQKIRELMNQEQIKFVKNPDEIVLEDVKMVHYETMEEGRSVWLGIYLNNGKMYHLNIGGDNLYVNYSDETV